MVPMSGDAGAQAVPQGHVPWWRRSIAVAAVMISALTTTWLTARSPNGAAGILLTFLAAIPALTPSRIFGRVSLAVAIAFFPIAVLGVYLALFVYLPVAALLLLAWLADPGARPRMAPVGALAGGAVFVLMAVAWSVAVHRGF